MSKPIPQSREQARDVVQIARAILNGSIGIIDGARRISAVRLYSGHVSQPKDEDYLLFLDIDQKTRHLPVGEIRRLWAADALLRTDAEIRDREDFYRDSSHQAAQNLVCKLEEYA